QRLVGEDPLRKERSGVLEESVGIVGRWKVGYQQLVLLRHGETPEGEECLPEQLAERVVQGKPRREREPAFRPHGSICAEAASSFQPSRWAPRRSSPVPNIDSPTSQPTRSVRSRPCVIRS